MNPHKIYISNKRGSEGNISTGANTEVSMDGVALRGVKSIKYEVDAKSIGKVTIEMYAQLDIDHDAVTTELIGPNFTEEG